MLEHLRHLRNFLAADHDVAELADVLLAVAHKYRHQASVTNTTYPYPYPYPHPYPYPYP